MNWTRHIFEPGKRYRVKQTFVSGGYNFSSGEVLVFESDGHVPYDSSFVYQFHSEADNQPKLWWHHEEEPVDKWQQYFEPVDDGTATPS